MKTLLQVIVALSLSQHLEASFNPPLGPPPESPSGVVESFHRMAPFETPEFRRKSNLDKALSYQTPVKSQGMRGTCSIFSTVAAVESLIKIATGEELDLSENYLQFLVMTKMKNKATPGSSAKINLPATAYYGAILESAWPYEVWDWAEEWLPEYEIRKKEFTCRKLTGNALDACLRSHLRPGSQEFEARAYNLKRDYRLERLQVRRTTNHVLIRQVLQTGRPVIAEVEVFYGAWNHGRKASLGLGEIDVDKWESGTVGIPTAQDITVSRQHPAGHSIEIIGYDDNKRVYYFKNSWGTDSFGIKSDLNGPGTSAGYGSIPYDYAHRYGSFFTIRN